MQFKSTQARVLFVDDEARITQMAEQVLVGQGLVVTALTSSSAGLAAFLAAPDEFDVVVLDHTMPEISGLELARRISSLRPGLPIVLLSGIVEIIPETLLRAAGITQCLPKPVPLSKLGALIHALLE